MTIRWWTVVAMMVLASLAASQCRALSPDEIMVIANRDVPGSVDLARYYAERRGVTSILELSLGELTDSISRSDYNSKVLGPVRKTVIEQELTQPVRCIVTVYGVPFKVGPRGPLPDKSAELTELRAKVKEQKDTLTRLTAENKKLTAQYKQANALLMRYNTDLHRITGEETGASLDSELSMARSEGYDLFRWQMNNLQNNPIPETSPTLMVSRLDGPSLEIARGLVDKALKTEEQGGLKGIAYIDSRGMAKRDAFGQFDRTVKNLADLIRRRHIMEVHQETTEALFQPGDCPQTAVYCGWYSLKKYIDAFDFVDGAIGYHIASFEAIHLRDPNSTEWCPAMLSDGVTATLGPVAEPYLHSFPQPDAFFGRLFDGRCLVEAYYATKPFNSWQLMLIGDPLYRPFKRP